MFVIYNLQRNLQQNSEKKSRYTFASEAEIFQSHFLRDET